MHCLLWVENAPNFDVHGKQAVANFIDTYITCSIPDEDEDPELRKIVLDVQQHSKKHSKSCKKNGAECRFNFPRPPSQRTFITEMHDDSNDDDAENAAENTELGKSRAKEISLNVWNKVQDNTMEFETTEELLHNVQLSQRMYENALNKLSKKNQQLFSKDSQVSCGQTSITHVSLNVGVQIWTFNRYFSCIVYIVSYISKFERDMGILLKQTKLEAQEGNLDAKHTLKNRICFFDS